MAQQDGARSSMHTKGTNGTRTTTTRTGRKLAAVGILGVMVLASLVVGVFAVSGMPSFAVGSPHGGLGHVVAAPPVGHASLAPATTGGLAVGQFFENTPIPLAASANRVCSVVGVATCPASLELNVTNDPVLAENASGTLAVAYTTLSDTTSCAAPVSNYVTSDVAIATSNDGGATWNTPSYVGNSVCAKGYPSSWEPALASLSDGTWVLAYVQYNETPGTLPPMWSTSPPPTSQLVFTELAPGATSWTTPTVLNVSVNPLYQGVYFAPAQPTIATHGNTIYLAWERLGTPYASIQQNSQIALLVSTNGGSTWSPTIPITNGYYDWAYAPSLLVSPNGTVYLAYDDTYGPGGSVNVELAVSYSEGTLFTTNAVAPYGYPWYFSGESYLGPFAGPTLHMAWDAVYGTLFVSFAAWDYDSNFVYTPTAELASTSDDGATWTLSSAATSALYNPTEYPSYTGNPSVDPGVWDVAVAVDSSGTVYLTGLVRNASMCVGGTCNILTEVAASSTDNGTTFGPALLVNGAVQPGPGSYIGETTSTYSDGSHLWVAYPETSCPTWPTAPCSAYNGTPLEQSQVTIGEPFVGTGVNLQFTPTNLNGTENWTLSFMGWNYTVNGLSSFTIVGFPTGQAAFWTVGGVNVTGWMRMYPTAQTQAPGVVSAGWTDTITFETFYPFQIGLGKSAASLAQLQCNYEGYYANNTYTNKGPFCTTPLSPNCLNPTYYYNSGQNPPYIELEYALYCSNLAVNSPTIVGQTGWFQAGTHLAANFTTRNYYNLYGRPSGICVTLPTGVNFVECSWSGKNVTFISWTGIGNSSVATNASQIYVTLNGPANETLNVLPTGGCSGISENYGQVYWGVFCSQSTTALSISETGLPDTVPWSVTVANATASVIASSTAPISINLRNLPIGIIYQVSAWDIPTSTPNMDWVGTVVGGSTVIPPFSTQATISYTLEDISSASFTMAVNETGLPSDSHWGYNVLDTTTSANTSYGAYGNGTAHLSATVGGYNVNAATVTFPNGTAYYLYEVIVTPHTVNASTVIGYGATSFALTGDANVTFVYAPEFWVSVQATTGGTASPASEWVKAGSFVTLTATPSAGMYFVGWTGTGPGATGSAARHLSTTTIKPLGPVTETAVFAVTPPPTWTLQVSSTGLPEGQIYTVELGGSAYAGTGDFAVKNLTTGVYDLSVPTVYDNVSLGVRYVATSELVSWSPSGSGYNVNTNGTLEITYDTEFLLTLSATAGGSTSPAAGTYWEVSGTTVVVTETALTNYYFVEWAGTGIGSTNSTSATPVTLNVLGPISEAAQFQVRPPPGIPTYTLTVTESGLGSGLTWGASVGTTGGSGTGAVNISGLTAGTYTLTVPIVGAGQGVQYKPQESSYAVTVSGNASYPVNFTEEFLVTISVSGSGSSAGTTTTVSQWYPSGATVDLSATAQSGWVFSAWNGSSAAGYTGTVATSSFTATGPVSELATFTPAPPPQQVTSHNSTDGLPLALVLLVALLVAGLVAGLLVSRRRRSPPAPPAAEVWESSGSDTAGEMNPPTGGEGGSEGNA